MIKTNKRKISLLVAVLMILSMASIFVVPSFAEDAVDAPYFSAAYNTDGTGEIKNTALLVDTTIGVNETEISREWDGKWYKFTVGTNAFSTLDAALAAVADNGQIIVTAYSESTDLAITKPVSIYAKNWNTAPMNEMGGDKLGTNWDGNDWTQNTTYTNNQVYCHSINISNSVAGAVKVYGFTVASTMYLGGYSGTANTTRVTSNSIQITVKNTRFTGSGKLFGNMYASNAANTDTVTIENLETPTTGIDSISYQQTGVSNAATFTLDGIYINATVNTEIFRNASNGVKTTIKNSYIANHKQLSPYGNGSVANLYINNNIFVNNGAAQTAMFALITNRWKTVNFINNFVYNAKATPLFNNVDSLGTSRKINLTVTGNKLLGFGNVADVLFLSTQKVSAVGAGFTATVNNNYFNNTTLSGSYANTYANEVGSQLPIKADDVAAVNAGAYYLDYGMAAGSLNTDANSNPFASSTQTGDIKNTALLVDTTLSATAGDTVYAKWDGVWYSFVYDTNAFNSVANALASANLDATNPQIIVTNHSASTEIKITKPVKIYAKNWNTAPMNEMTGADAKNWTGADWTQNTKYNENEVFCKNFNIQNDIVGTVGVYGFTVSGGTIYPAGYNTTRDTSKNVTLIFENIRYTRANGSTKIFANMYTTSAYTNSDSVTLKNFEIANTAGGIGADKAGIQQAATFIMDGVYYNTDVMANASIDVFRITASNVQTVIKNSYFAGVKGGLNLYGGSNGQPGTLTITNNIFNNFGSVTTAIFNAKPNCYASFNFTNNFVYNPNNKPLLANASGQSKAVVNVTGNKLLGFGTAPDMLSISTGTTFNGATSVVINSNYLSSEIITLSEGQTFADVYGSKVGTQFVLTGNNADVATLGAYYLDYDMTVLNTDAKLTGVEAGTSDATDVVLDKENNTISFKLVGADDSANGMAFTYVNNTALAGKWLNGETEISAADMTHANLQSIAGEGAKNITLTYRVYYKADASYFTDYTVTIVLYEAPAFVGNYQNATIADTALLVDSSINGEDGDAHFATWEGRDYKFVVGENAFKTVAAALASGKLDSTNPQIIAVSASVGEVKIDKPVKIYGKNYNTAPMNEMTGADATKWNGADWTQNSAYDANEQTCTNLLVQNTVTGDVGFYGFTITQRIRLSGWGTSATTRDGSLPINIELANIRFESDKVASETVFVNTYPSAVANNDVITIKNFEVASSAKSLFNSNTGPANASTFTLDGVYLDTVKMSASQYDQFRGNANSVSTTIQNSYFGGNASNTGFYLFGNGGKMSLTVHNNIFNDFGSQTAMFAATPSRVKTLDFTNNFVYNPNSKPIFANSAATTNVTVTITGNKLLGFGGIADMLHATTGNTFAAASSVVINNNFVANVADTATDGNFAEVYGSKAGTQFAIDADTNGTNATIGDYYINYNMSILNSQVKIDSVTAGTDAKNVEADLENNAFAFELTTGTIDLNIVLGHQNLNGKWFNGENELSDLSFESINAIANGQETATLTYRVYETQTQYAVDYTVTVTVKTAPTFFGNYVNETIKDTAILVDTGIGSTIVPKADGSIVVNWEGQDYKFIVNENAFNSFATALNHVNAENPQIIVTTAGASVELKATKAVKVYAKNWNRAPMNEMTGADATKWNGANWTQNTEYNNNEVVCKNFNIANDVEGFVGFYGFTVTGGTIYPAGYNTTRDGTTSVTIEFVNTRFDRAHGSAKIFADMYGTSGLANSDTVTLKNFEITSTSTAGGLFNDGKGAQNASTFTLDGVYMDTDDMTNAAIEKFRGNTGSQSLTITNSYFGGSKGGFWLYGPSSQAVGPTLEISNNIFNNFGSITTTTGYLAMFSAKPGYYSTIDFVDNFVYNPHNAPIFQNAGNSNGVVFTMTGNRLLGFEGSTAMLATAASGLFGGAESVTVNSNYLANQNKEVTDGNFYDAYATVAGSQFIVGADNQPEGYVAGDYYVDYNMAILNSQVKLTDVVAGGNATNFAADLENNAFAFELTEGAAEFTFTYGHPNLNGKWLDKNGEAVADLTFETISALANGSDTVTLTYRVYETQSQYSNDYTVTVTVKTVLTFVGNYQNATIKDTALLVDINVKGETGDGYLATWEGTEYKFVVGENAFKSVAAALSSGKLDSTNPQIIVVNHGNTEIKVDRPVKIYAKNWNRAPMNEMTGADATKWNGANWTQNTEYNNNEVVCKNFNIANDVEGFVGFYGFTVTGGTIYPAGYNTTRDTSKSVTIEFANTRFDRAHGEKLIFADMYTTGAYENTDTVILRNFEISAKEGNTAKAFALDKAGIFSASTIVLDGVYMDTDVMTYGGVDTFRTTASGVSTTIKNSFFTGTKGGFQFYGGSSSDTATLTINNNIFNNFGATATAMFNAKPNCYGSVNVTNNFVYNPTTKPIFNNLSGQSGANVAITGNRMLGFEGATEVLSTDTNYFTGGAVSINSNYLVQENLTLDENQTFIDVYGSKAGSQVVLGEKNSEVTTLGDYYVDYNMAILNSQVKLTDVVAGGNATNFAADLENNAFAFELTEGAAEFTFTYGHPNLNGKWLDKNGEAVADLTFETISALANGSDTATLTYRVYETQSQYSNDYTVTVTVKLVPTFVGNYVNATIKDTALLVDPNVKGSTGDGYLATWEGTEYKFEVNVNAFKSVAAALSSGKLDSTNPQIIVVNHGNTEIKVDRPVKIYAKNWNRAPMNEMTGADATKWNGADWTENTEYNNNEVICKNFNITNDVEGFVGFYGFTVVGGTIYPAGYNTTRDTSKSVTIEFANTRFDRAHGEKLIFADMYTTGAYENTDTVILRNFEISAKEGNTAKAFALDKAGIFSASTIVLDGVYMDTDVMSYGGVDTFRTTASGVSTTIQNSFFTGTKGGFQFYGGASSDTAALTINNNIFNNFGATATAMFNAKPNCYGSVNVTNNFVYNPNSKPIFNNLSGQSGAVVSITGNRLLGFAELADMLSVAGGNSFNSAASVDINSNYVVQENLTLGENQTFIDVYGSKAGSQFALDAESNGEKATLGDYYINYNMSILNSQVKIDSVTAGTDAKNVETDLANKKFAFELTSGTVDLVISLANDSLNGKWFNGENELSDLSFESINAIANGQETATLTYRVYETQSQYAVDYTVTVTVKTAPTFFGNYVNETIKDTAILVDTGIGSTIVPKADGSIVVNWEGQDYKFIVNENAFKSFATALNHVNAENPQIIVTTAGASVELKATKAVKVYAKNWNRAPMNEMTGADATKWNGADWTQNTEYNNNEVVCKNFNIANDVEGFVGFYGFTVVGGTIYPAGYNTTRDGTTSVTIELVNTRFDRAHGNNTIFANMYTDNIVNGDSITLKNFEVSAKDGNSAKSFATDKTGIFSASTIVLDGVYMDTDVMSYGGVDTFRTTANSVSTTIKNSFLTGTKGGFNFYGGATTDTATLTIQNNIFNNFGATATAIFNAKPNCYGSVNITNNFVYNPTTKPLFNNLSGQSGAVVNITGNRLLGFEGATEVLSTNQNFFTQGAVSINSNYLAQYNLTLGETDTFIDVYGSKAGSQVVLGEENTAVTTLGAFYVNYNMDVLDTQVTVNNVTAGGDAANVEADLANNAFAFELTEGTADPSFTYGHPNLNGKWLDGEGNDIASLTFDALSALANGSDTVTITYRVYETQSQYSNDYTVTVTVKLVPTFVGNYVNATIKDTALLVDPNVKGSTGDGYLATWEGTEYKFEVNVNAFSSFNAALTALGNKTDGQIIVTNYSATTDLKVTKPVRVYAKNWNTAPMTQMGGDKLGKNWDGTAWTQNPDYTNNQVHAKISIASSVTGFVGLYGFTISSGQVRLAAYNDTRAADAEGASRIEIELVNTRYTYNVGTSKTIFDNVYTDAAALNNDKITIKNFEIQDTDDATVTAKNLFAVNQGPQNAATFTFDGLYMNTDKMNASTADNFRGHANSVSATIKNSYLTGSKAGFYFYGPASKQASPLTLTISNNIINNFGALASAETNAAMFQAKPGWFSAINFTDNFVYNPHAAAMFQNLGNTNGVALTMTGNRLLGFEGASNILSVGTAGNFTASGSLTINSNYHVNKNITPAGDQTIPAAYASYVGTQFDVGSNHPTVFVKGAYVVDYTMTTLNTDLLVNTVTGIEGATLNQGTNTIAFNLFEGDATGLVITHGDTNEPPVTNTKWIDKQGNPVADLTRDTLLALANGSNMLEIYYVIECKANTNANETYTVAIKLQEAYAFTDATHGYNTDGTGEIKNTALLVDINAPASGTYKASWDGGEYLFTVGTNAFKTVALALASANLDVANPQIIVISHGASTEIKIDKPVKIYAKNWNRAPMNEMGSDAKDWTGADWTNNPEYLANEVECKNFNIQKDIEGTVGLYGFTVSGGAIYPAGYNTTRDTTKSVNLEFVNIRYTRNQGSNKIFANMYEGLVENTDTVLLKNFEIVGTAGGLGTDSKGIQVADKVTLDGVYMNTDKMTNAAIDYYRATATTDSLTIKNSYFTGSKGSFNLYGYNGEEPAVTLEINNNVINNFGSIATAIFNVTPTRYASITVKDNFIYDTKSKALFANITGADGVNLTVTGNRFLGFEGVTDVLSVAGGNTFGAAASVTINNNFFSPVNRTLAEGQTMADVYGSDIGSQIPLAGKNAETISLGGYYLDYRFNVTNKDLELSTVTGADEIELDNVKHRLNFTKVSGSTADLGYTFASSKGEGKWYINAISEGEESVSITDLVSANPELKIIDLTYKVHYKQDAKYFVAYRVRITVDGNIKTFIDGYALDNPDSIIDERAFIVTTEAIDMLEGDKIAAKWDGEYYWFTVGKNAFATMADAHGYAARLASTPTIDDPTYYEYPQILVESLTANETTGKTLLRIDAPARVYGPNYATAPLSAMVGDSLVATAWDGTDWADDAGLAAYKANALVVDYISFANTISGAAEVYGFTVNGYIAVNGTPSSLNGGTSAWRNADSDTVNYTIGNIIVNTTDHVFYRNSGAVLLDGSGDSELCIKNMYIENARSIFHNASYPAYTTFDGLYADITNCDQPSYAYSTAGDSVFTLKNSFVTGTSTYELEFGNTTNTEGSKIVELLNNVLTYDAKMTGIDVNNNEGANELSVIVTNNYIDKKGETGAIVTLRAENACDSLTVTGNKVVNYAYGDDNPVAVNNSAFADMTVENNYVSATNDSVKGVKLYATTDVKGGDYYLNGDMLDANLAYNNITVDIAWGALSFNYSAGSWDPVSHTRGEAGWEPTATDANKITATNADRTDITVDYVFDAAEKLETDFDDYAGEFVDSEGKALTTADIAGDNNNSQVVWLNLWGVAKPGIDHFTQTVLGYLTITVDA